MKITMIGTSGCGKTVFSAGVYMVYMLQEFEGFQIAAQGQDFGSQLVNEHKFGRDYATLARKQWPQGTQGFTPFALDLFYEGQRVTNFDWIDYRGGFLDDPEIDPEKAMEIYANIAASNAVVLFADAQKLTETDNPQEAAFTSGAGAVSQILSGFARKYPGTSLTFLIALSKADAVSGEWKGIDNSFQKLTTFGWQVFSPLKTVLQRETKWRGGIIALSTMGEGRVNDHGEIIGYPSPIGIAEAMSFCIGNALRVQESDTFSKLLDEEIRIASIQVGYTGVLGLLRRTIDYFDKSHDTDLDKLRRLRTDRGAEMLLLSRIRGPMQKLHDIAMRRVRLVT